MVVISTAAFYARVRGSVPGLGGLKERKMFLPHPRVKVSIVGSLCDREVACPASDRQGSNFESCGWRTVSSQSSHHPQEVLLALYVHKGGLYKARFISFFCHLIKTISTQLFTTSRNFPFYSSLFNYQNVEIVSYSACQPYSCVWHLGRQLDIYFPLYFTKHVGLHVLL